MNELRIVIDFAQAYFQHWRDLGGNAGPLLGFLAHAALMSAIILPRRFL